MNIHDRSDELGLRGLRLIKSERKNSPYSPATSFPGIRIRQSEMSLALNSLDSIAHQNVIERSSFCSPKRLPERQARS